MALSGLKCRTLLINIKFYKITENPPHARKWVSECRTGCIYDLKYILHNHTWTDNVSLAHITIYVDFYSHYVDFYSMSTID